VPTPGAGRGRIGLRCTLSSRLAWSGVLAIKEIVIGGMYFLSY